MVFPKKCLSIDIGNNQIKIADIVRKGDKVKVLNFDVLKTPEGAFNDGFIVDKQVIANTIKGSIKSNKFKAKEVIYTVASSKVITREVDFPNIHPNKLKNIIDINAEEYFPVNLMDYTLGHTVIETIEDNGEKKLRVNIIAAFTGLIEDYVGLTSLIGMKLAGIDYAGNSLANFIKREKNQGTNIVLDFGSESTMVSIVKDGVTKFNRNLLFGSNLLIDCVKNHFEVGSEEAVRISGERPLLNVEENDNPYLSNDVSGAMNQILSGISRLVDYYTSRNSDKFDNIYIVGGGSNIAGIEEYVENYFNIPTKKMTEIKSASYKGNKDFVDVQLYFAAAIGACFSDVSLVPKSLVVKSKAKGNRRVVVLFIILLVLVAGYFSSNQVMSIIQLSNKKATLEQDIQEAQYITELKTEYEAATKKNTFRKDIIESAKSTTQGFNEVLSIMEETMPTEVLYLSMSNSEDSLNMDCVAKDSLTVAKFIETLKAAGYEDVSVPALNTIGEAEDSVVAFTLTCKYPEGEVAEEDVE